jgi:hypothetical protein
MKYEKIGLKNFCVLHLEKMLNKIAEERYDDYLRHEMLEVIVDETSDKIIEKLSDILSEEFIKRLKEKEEK